MLYRDYVTPNDDGVVCEKDSDSIQLAISRAVEYGCNKVVIPRFNARSKSNRWIIDKTILLPDGIYLILDNCYMVLADDIICNMFTNENCHTDAGGTLSGTNRDIIIEGNGNVILDGGNYNGYSELTYDRENGPNIIHNCMLMFRNVDGFSVSGLKIKNQRYWAMNFVFCCNGKIHDIEFMANCSYVDENGEIQNCLSRDIPYESMCVINADGIDIRAGCHDIIIENIRGFTQDDTVALTGLYGEKKYEVETMTYDIRNIIIRNIMSSSLYANVRLLNMGGVKIYNVLIDGIMDSSKDFPGLERGSSAVRVGDKIMYGSRHATSDEIYNVTVRNVYSRAIAPLDIVCQMKNFNFDNIMSFDK